MSELSPQAETSDMELAAAKEVKTQPCSSV